jgi:CubicO group peptidase (beta-lactamase class C family)
MRRVDPEGRSLGRVFREELVEPLGLEFYIGLPEAIPRERLAAIELPNPIESLLSLTKVPKTMVPRILDPNSLMMRSFEIPRGFRPNKREALAVEQPSSNGVGLIRSMAKIYSVFAEGGEELGISEETIEEITAPALEPEGGFADTVMGGISYFGLGFVKPGPDVWFGSSQKAFGAAGAGGSFGFADPDARLAYAYAMTKMGVGARNDVRESALRAAVYRCLSRLEGGSAK